MATYHGLEHLECLACGWQTREDDHIEDINDGDGDCPVCEKQFFLWSSEDGEQVVTSGHGCEVVSIGKGRVQRKRTSDSRGFFRIRQAWGK
jgi:Zn ribbon nucleic-acid-binding protein